MKEFDFVKLTLWIALALTAALGGTYVWLGMKLKQLDLDVKSVEGEAKNVGRITHDLKTLDEMKRNDKLKDDSVVGIHSYFAEQARSTRGIARRPPRGIGTLDGRTATPYPARASAISVWGAPLSSSTSGRMFATWQAASNQSREPKSRRRSSSDSSDSSAISMTARRARG